MLLSQIIAVIVLSQTNTTSLIRELSVRGIPTVTVGRDAQPMLTHLVMLDRYSAFASAGRHLMLCGHRRVAAVEPPFSTMVIDVLGQFALPNDSAFIVESCQPLEAAKRAHSGVTAFVCASTDLAMMVREV